jgi:hypothetical protein
VFLEHFLRGALQLVKVHLRIAFLVFDLIIFFIVMEREVWLKAYEEVFVAWILGLDNGFCYAVLEYIFY